jgi:hypothetical protein
MSFVEFLVAFADAVQAFEPEPLSEHDHAAYAAAEAQQHARDCES